MTVFGASGFLGRYICNRLGISALVCSCSFSFSSIFFLLWTGNSGAIRYTLSDWFCLPLTRYAESPGLGFGNSLHMIARAGCTVVVPYREDMAKRHLKLTGDLGRVVFMVWRAFIFFQPLIPDSFFLFPLPMSSTLPFSTPLDC